MTYYAINHLLIHKQNKTRYITDKRLINKNKIMKVFRECEVKTSEVFQYKDGRILILRKDSNDNTTLVELNKNEVDAIVTNSDKYKKITNITKPALKIHLDKDSRKLNVETSNSTHTIRCANQPFTYLCATLLENNAISVENAIKYFHGYSK